MIQTRISALRTATIAIALLVAQVAAIAQSGDYHEPLNEKLPPGYTADVLARIRQYDPSWLQPVRVELPTAGEVSVYSATPDPLASIAAPAQFSVNAGHLYRLRISNMPEFPGVEIYPSIEILDRLHPPQGSAANYPIPIVLTEADLKEAIDGHMVTRIIYLENPRNAAAADPLRRQSPQMVRPENNALQEAGFLGRPMIIVRIGGRVPSGSQMPMSFFGTGGAFDLGESVTVNTGVVKLSDRKKAASSMVSRQP
jgi:hypothetical protein